MALRLTHLIRFPWNRCFGLSRVPTKGCGLFKQIVLQFVHQTIADYLFDKFPIQESSTTIVVSPFGFFTFTACT